MTKKPDQSVHRMHPSDIDENWQPPIGPDPIPGEKIHIWQEFKRDLHMTRRAGQPFWGRGWPVLLGVILSIAFSMWLELGGGPQWLLAIRNLF